MRLTLIEEIVLFSKVKDLLNNKKLGKKLFFNQELKLEQRWINDICLIFMPITIYIK